VGGAHNLVEADNGSVIVQQTLPEQEGISWIKSTDGRYIDGPFTDVIEVGRQVQRRSSRDRRCRAGQRQDQHKDQRPDCRCDD
jgi:hypothetical protein